MHSPADSHAFNVLLLQNDPSETRAIMEVVQQIRPAINVTLVHDEQELAASRHGGPRPDVILLDLSLAWRKNPYDLLTDMKTDCTWGQVPVAILGPDSEWDIDYSFACGADLYIAKPMDRQRLMILLHWTKEL